MSAEIIRCDVCGQPHASDAHRDPNVAAHEWARSICAAERIRDQRTAAAHESEATIWAAHTKSLMRRPEAKGAR